ncbi:Hsp33 family molecular chaperone [Blastochloris viridis]|uniref:Chaperone protein Hsp33 n=1 Tax=Blastochloris viridis TaxID=1079 RepID=A0A0H5BFC3_BLAVI|nr:Hsp33 family molecular chaperone [Blastochloris viridis]ALK10959.1 33 kDa chaperonin [Blastochloris viridis]BAR99056.1 chaperone protein Hsp33 [Blastochloris viridis]CUU43621.1 Heat shock protein 33 [Blastochloris viridis]
MTAEVPGRLPDPVAEQDRITPFQVDTLDVRGRIVTLGPAVDAVIAGHGYPEPVSRVLGEAVALGVLLGTALKFDGRFILQTQTDGPVRMLVVDFETPDKIRACARFDAELVAAATDTRPAAMIGRGHLAMTIDQGPDMSRYQGVVELAGQGLEAAAHQYFAQSEQIPTFVRLAVAEEMTATADGTKRSWRAGGLMVQFMPADPERMARADLDPGDAPAGIEPGTVAEDDAWVEARTLAATVEDHELVDPALSSERLLWRLFNERGVRVFAPRPVTNFCRCSVETIRDMLNRFSLDDRQHMVEDGKITVTCEFCSSRYIVEPSEVGIPDASATD